MQTWFWLFMLPVLLTALTFLYIRANVYAGRMFDNWVWVLFFVGALVPILDWFNYLLLMFIIGAGINEDGRRAESHRKFNENTTEDRFLKPSRLNKFLFSSHFTENKKD